MSSTDQELDLRVPELADTDDIELVEWHVEPGEVFEEGDELCDMVTDKAAFSLEAPFKGRVTEISVENRTKVKRGQSVGRMVRV